MLSVSADNGEVTIRTRTPDMAWMVMVEIYGAVKVRCSAHEHRNQAINRFPTRAIWRFLPILVIALCASRGLAVMESRSLFAAGIATVGVYYLGNKVNASA